MNSELGTTSDQGWVSQNMAVLDGRPTLTNNCVIKTSLLERT